MSSASAASAASAAAASSTAASTAAAATPDSSDDDLLCCACACVYHDPLSLPCGHVMCASCMRAWATRSQAIVAEAAEHTLELMGLLDDEVKTIWNGPVHTGRAIPQAKHLRLVSLADRCSLCLGHETPQHDLIYCDRCNVCVHPECYAIQVPAEDVPWYCEPCEDAIKDGKGGAAAADGKARTHAQAGRAASSAGASSAAASASSAPAAFASSPQKRKPNAATSAADSSVITPECCVCPNRTDRLLKRVVLSGKNNSNGKPRRRYIHLSCASYLEGPEWDLGTPVRNVDQIGPQWFKLPCQFCSEPGAATQCKYGKCVRSYHVPCGLRHGALGCLKTIKKESAAGGPAQVEVYSDSVCALHRKHIRTVAHAHEHGSSSTAQQRKASRERSKRKGNNRSASAAHMVTMPCSSCRKQAQLLLSHPTLGLPLHESLHARSQAYRLAHPDEDAEMEALLAKYPGSRGHDREDTSSDDENEEDKEQGRQKQQAAAAAGHMLPMARSKTDPTPVGTAGSQATAAAATSVSAHSDRVPSRSLRAAASAASSSAVSPTRARSRDAPRSAGGSSHQRSGSRTPLSPPSSLSLLSPPPGLHVHGLSPRQLMSSLVAQPLTPSKRKQAASSNGSAAAAAPSPPPLANRRRMHSPSFDSQMDVNVDEDELMLAPAPSRSQGAAAAAAGTVTPSPTAADASSSRHLLRSHSEPAHAAMLEAEGGAAGSPHAMFIAKQHSHRSSSRNAAATAAASPRRPASSAGGSAHSAAQSSCFDLTLEDEEEGLEILHFKPGSKTERARRGVRQSASTASAAAAASPTRSSSRGASSRTASLHTAALGAAPMRVDDGDGSSSAEVAASSTKQAEVLALLESFDHFVQQELSSGGTAVTRTLTHAGQHAAAASGASSSSLSQSAPLTPAHRPVSRLFCGRLQNLRGALRMQTELLGGGSGGIVTDSAPAPTSVELGRLSLILSSLEVGLRALLGEQLRACRQKQAAAAAPGSARRSARNKSRLEQRAEAIIGDIIDPLLAEYAS